MEDAAAAMTEGDNSRLVKRSVTLAGHRTSLSLEVIFWEQLVHIAESRSQSVNSLVAEIDETRQGNLSSAVRVFILEWALEGATLPPRHSPT
jgi:predicted DNA-binding ribbon-helix-helix protein